MRPEFDEYTGTFHKTEIAREQARLAREVHSGVDPEEGANCINGMILSCAVTAAIAVAIVAFTIATCK